MYRASGFEEAIANEHRIHLQLYAAFCCTVASEGGLLGAVPIILQVCDSAFYVF